MKLGLFASHLKLSFCYFLNELITLYYLQLRDSSRNGVYSSSTSFVEVDRNITQEFT